MMNTELKRRAFLTSIIGVLVGAPLAARFLLHGEPDEAHRFSADLKKYRELFSVPIREIGDHPPVALTLAPPPEGMWKYVMFSPSSWPKELSRATENEPDSFLVREGNLFLGQTVNGKNLIGGGDAVSRICTPVGMEDQPVHALTMLCENGRLTLAKPTTANVKSRQDLQLRHLLGLETVPRKELTIGMRWRSDLGRVKPFDGVRTDYEVVGFAEVAGRTTVNIGFSGMIAMTVPAPGKPNGRKSPVKEPSVTNIHHGNAWFDVETGFLVRQECDMECRMSGIEGYRGTDGSDGVTVITKSLLQILPA